MSDYYAHSQQDRCILTNLYQDVYIYIASFLNGKELAILSVTSHKSNKDHILERFAYNEFKKEHPHLPFVSNKGTLLIHGYTRLFEERARINVPHAIKMTILQFHDDINLMPLGQKHAMFTGHAINSCYYFYYLTTCNLTIQEVHPRFKELQSQTDFAFLGHINYFMEKVMSFGSIVLLIRSLQYFQNNVHISNAIRDQLKDTFVKRLLSIYTHLDWSENGENDHDYLVSKIKFKKESKLYLFKYFKDLVKHFIGDTYDILIHLELTECCEWGLVDLACEYRRIGALIRPPMHLEREWWQELHRLQLPYVFGVFFQNIENPQLCTAERWITKDLLQRKLDAALAVYSVGNVRECEKFQKEQLLYITKNKSKCFTVQQMADFADGLLNTNGVQSHLKNDLALWCFLNDAIES